MAKCSFNEFRAKQGQLPYEGEISKCPKVDQDSGEVFKQRADK